MKRIFWLRSSGIRRTVIHRRRAVQRQSRQRKNFVNVQVVRVDVVYSPIERVEISVASDGQDELVTLSVVVAVVVILAVVWIVFVPIRILLQLRRARRTQLQHFLLEVPSDTRVVGPRRRNRFIRILRAIVEIALQVLSLPGDERKVVRLHALRARIGHLISHGVTITRGLQSHRRAGLLQRPRPSENISLARRSVAGPDGCRILGPNLCGNSQHRQQSNRREYSSIHKSISLRRTLRLRPAISPSQGTLPGWLAVLNESRVNIL